MQYFMWIIKALLFFLILSFAIVNTDPVTVRYYLGYQWQAPLVLVLLVTACIGVAAGLLVGLYQVLRMRSRLTALQRELQLLKQTGPSGGEPGSR